MSNLDITVSNHQTAFRPGETVEGTAVWQFDRAAEWLEVRLVWFTQGKGDSDVSVEDRLRVENPAANDSRPFRFFLPAAPYSFSGRLISLIWAVEIVAEGVKEAARYEFMLSPDGAEIELGIATAHLTPREKALQDKALSWVARRAQKSGVPGSNDVSPSGPWSNIK